MSAAAPGRALAVDADLRLEVGGQTVHVGGEGSRLVVDVPSRRALRGLLRAVPGGGRAGLREAQRWLDEADLTADVRLRGRRLARLGAGARPDAVSRLLRLGEAQLRPPAALPSEPRGTTAPRRGAPSWRLLGGLAFAAGALLVVQRLLRR